VIAYEPEAWTDLFVASAGASAALAGLVFVAVSINIDRIIGGEGLADRALQALFQLLAIVIVSLIALAPGQSSAALGIELLAVGLLVAGGSFALLGRAQAAAQTTRGWPARRLAVAAGTVPTAIAGISLIAESGGGLYWLFAGAIVAIVVAVLNAWVLLVEILR
jgi:modulator of FtsH protease